MLLHAAEARGARARLLQHLSAPVIENLENRRVGKIRFCFTFSSQLDQLRARRNFHTPPMERKGRFIFGGALPKFIRRNNSRKRCSLCFQRRWQML